MKIKMVIIFFLLTATTISYANVTPSDLIKVTNEASAKCVEYYSYQGEMYCSTKAFSKEPSDASIKSYETQNIVFDNRIWRRAWGQKTSESMMVEYVPNNDDINNWYELVTSQYFSGIPQSATPKEFADMIIKGIEDAGFKPIVTYYKNTPTQVLFEFRIIAPANQIQDELQIVTKRSDGFYVLHYVIKKADMGALKRKEWIGNLEKSAIK